MNKQLKIGALLSYVNIILKNIVTFIYTPILLIYVGQANYGLFQMTNSVILSLGILSLGLSSAYVKFYVSYAVKDEIDNIKKLNGIYLIVFVLIAIISFILGLIFAFNTQKIFNKSLTLDEIKLTKKLMIILAINLSLTFPSSVFDSNILVHEKFQFQQFRQFLQILLVPIVSIPLVIYGFGVLSIGVVQTLVTFIFLILNATYCVKHLNMKFQFKNIPLGLLKGLLSFSLFILLNQIVDIVNNNIPSFILGILLGAKDVAIFAIAIQIKNMFFMLSTSLSTIFIPRVNHIVNVTGDTKELTNLMVKVGRIQMNILFFVMGGFILLGEFFISKWAGKDNLNAYYLIIIMVLPSIIPLSQNIGIEIQRAFNMHIFRSIVYTIFAVFNLLATYLGIIYFGLVGATFGYVISIIVANGFMMNWYYHKKMNLDMLYYWKNTLNLLFPFAITTFFLKLLTNKIPVNSSFLFLLFGSLYSAIYFVIFICFSATKFEKNLLKLKK